MAHAAGKKSKRRKEHGEERRTESTYLTWVVKHGRQGRYTGKGQVHQHGFQCRRRYKRYKLSGQDDDTKTDALRCDAEDAWHAWARTNGVIT
jgi:hypothetical protein